MVEKVVYAVLRRRKEGGRGHGRALKNADPWLFGAKSLALVSLASGVAGSSSEHQARICHPSLIVIRQVLGA